jgi:hypothetical protein
MSRVETFRSKLQHLLKVMEDKQEQTDYERGIITVVKTIKKDYDAMFPPDVYQASVRGIKEKAAVFCFKTGCPLCGKELKSKYVHSGMYYLCANFPQCKGIRNLDGSIPISSHVKDYIADREYEIKVQEAEEAFGRFDVFDEG